jgi:transcriptional regulator GlxA family with amidase domain
MREAGTIVVPGCSEQASAPAPEVFDALRAAAAAGTRIASICAGAFTLAAAGLLDGLDLCLHLIRRDFGSAVAAESARLSVVPLEREGGQAQFVPHARPPAPLGSVLEPVLAWIEDNLAGS